MYNNSLELKNNMRISYSSLTSFLQCPAKYKFQQIDRVPVIPSDELWYGSMIHTILEEVVGNSDRLSLEYAIARLQKDWQNNRFKTTEKNFEKFKEAQAMLVTFFKDHFERATRNLKSVEEFFEIYHKDHKIVGKIDRINLNPDGSVLITDYKTGAKLPYKDSLDFDDQLTFYFWAATNLFPKYKKVNLCLHYLLPNKLLLTSRDKKHIERLQKKIEVTAEQIKNSDFSPKKNRLCDWCEYRHLCPLFTKKPKLFI